MASADVAVRFRLRHMHLYRETVRTVKCKVLFLLLEIPPQSSSVAVEMVGLQSHSLEKHLTG